MDSNDPFRARIAANPIDQNYLMAAYAKWKCRKHRDRATVVVFVHRDGTRRHRILGPGQFRASLMRVGESAHQLAIFDRQGGVYIEPEFAAETEGYRDFIAQYGHPVSEQGAYRESN